MILKKVGLMLILGGIITALLSIAWFVTAYAETMDFVNQYGGADMSSKLIACLYSSPAICQGAAFLNDAPSYSPVVFWIGVIALLAGTIVRLSTKNSAAEHNSARSPAESGMEGLPGKHRDLPAFIPAHKYTRTAYILVLTGAAGGLLLSPLAIIGLAGLVMALLGLAIFKPCLSELDINHLAAICIAAGTTLLLLILTRGSPFFLPAALAQIALFHIGFNSYRQRRIIGISNLKDEARLAMKPISQRFSNHERH